MNGHDGCCCPRGGQPRGPADPVLVRPDRRGARAAGLVRRPAAALAGAAARPGRGRSAAARGGAAGPRQPGHARTASGHSACSRRRTSCWPWSSATTTRSTRPRPRSTCCSGSACRCCRCCSGRSGGWSTRSARCSSCSPGCCGPTPRPDSPRCPRGSATGRLRCRCCRSSGSSWCRGSRTRRLPTLRLYFACYLAVHLLAATYFGSRWFDRGDGFEVFSSLLGRLSVFGRRGDGRLVVRSPLDGVAGHREGAGTVRRRRCAARLDGVRLAERPPGLDRLRADRSAAAARRVDARAGGDRHCGDRGRSRARPR